MPKTTSLKSLSAGHGQKMAARALVMVQGAHLGVHGTAKAAHYRITAVQLAHAMASVRTALLSCSTAAKARIFTLIGGSSDEILDVIPTGGKQWSVLLA
jgi:hypothetical protein